MSIFFDVSKQTAIVPGTQRRLATFSRLMVIPQDPERLKAIKEALRLGDEDEFNQGSIYRHFSIVETRRPTIKRLGAITVPAAALTVYAKQFAKPIDPHDQPLYIKGAFQPKIIKGSVHVQDPAGHKARCDTFVERHMVETICGSLVNTAKNVQWVADHKEFEADPCEACMAAIERINAYLKEAKTI